MQLQQQLAPIWRAYKEQPTGSLSCIADLHTISAVLQYRRSCDQTRLSHILVYKKNRGKLIRLLTNGTGSNVSREDPLRSTNWAVDGQPTVFPTFPQCSAVLTVPKLLHGLPGCIHKAVDCRFLMQN